MNARRLLFVLVFVTGAAHAGALQIRDVQYDSGRFDPARQETVTIRFSLSEQAKVDLNLFDGRDLLVRSIHSDNVLASGTQRMVWDGNDQSGKPVPPGAYHYTLVATSPSGERVEHDLTDITGGQDLVVKGIHWDPDKGSIQYVLIENARVNIRIGMKDGGPLLRTLIDWVPRAGGARSEPWDGMDESGVLDLSKHPQLMIAVQAFSLSDNTLLVGPDIRENQLIEEMSWPVSKRVVKQEHDKRMYAHAQQPLEGRGDFGISLKLPHGVKRDKAGVPVVTGLVSVRLDVDARDRARALATRFEPVFFLDGVFVFENETGYLPMTWNWDTSAVNEGTHYLTANLRGYEGNFGMATVRVVVQKEKPSHVE